MTDKIDFNKKKSKMNTKMSFNNELQYNALIKANIIANEKIKPATRNQWMKKNVNRNFCRKQIIEENHQNKNSQKEEKCLPDDFFKNNIFQYYYSTIEYMKKYFNSYMKSDNNNNISKNNNTLNENNYHYWDKSIKSVPYVNSLNANINNNMKNNNYFINYYKDLKNNFIYKNVNDKNIICSFTFLNLILYFIFPKKIYYLKVRTEHSSYPHFST